MSSVNGIPEHLPRNIALLFDRGRRRADLGEVIRRWSADSVNSDLEPVVNAMPGSHVRLLLHVPPEGARVTDIAEMAAITKQSTGQLLRRLTAWELIDTIADPSDRRVKRIRRTDLGDRLCAEVEMLISELEDFWRALVGAADYETMRRVLSDIITAPTSPRP